MYEYEGKKKMSVNRTGIPDNVKARFEKRSGYSFDDVRVHYNSERPAQFQALAYTQGQNVYIGPGQERHLGHELGHVVQQMEGRVRPTMNINGQPVNDDVYLEREAERGDFGRGAGESVSRKVVQRYLIIKDKDYTEEYYNNKREAPDEAETKLKSEITGIAREMIKELDDRRKRPGIKAEDYTYITNLINQICKDAGGELRTQTERWIKDEVGTPGSNIDFGKKFQPRAYRTFYEAALALTGWVNAKPGRREEKTKALEIMKDKAISYHLDTVFMRLMGLIGRHSKKDEIIREIKVEGKITNTKREDVKWTVYRSYFARKAGTHRLPPHWDVLESPSNYNIEEKIGVLHDLMHYFLEKFGSNYLIGGLDFTATTLYGRKPYRRPESSQIRGDMWAVKDGRGHLDLTSPDQVKFSTEEGDESYEYARRKHLPMYGRHSYSAARMMGLAKKSGATEEEIASVGWAIMAYWRVCYDHTSLPYHTAHEIMDFSPAFDIEYNPERRFAGYERIKGDNFLRFLFREIIIGDEYVADRAADAVIIYFPTEFETARSLLMHPELWDNGKIMSFLSTTILPIEEFKRLPTTELREFFQYNLHTQGLFKKLPKEKKDYVEGAES